jgi:hypothetical protein
MNKSGGGRFRYTVREICELTQMRLGQVRVCRPVEMCISRPRRLGRVHILRTGKTGCRG